MTADPHRTAGKDRDDMSETERRMAQHEPLAVITADGMLFVKCSCTNKVKPQSRVWLDDHWPGDIDSGVAELRKVVARQAGRSPEHDRDEVREQVARESRPRCVRCGARAIYDPRGCRYVHEDPAVSLAVDHAARVILAPAPAGDSGGGRGAAPAAADDAGRP